MLAYAPLFAGPVLAGWSRQPSGIAWIFALLFLLSMTWLRRPDLSRGEGWAQFAVLAVVQVALAHALTGFGRLLGAVVAFPDLPPWGPLGLSGAAALFAMTRYRHADAMDRMLDEAVATLEGMEAGAERPAPVRRFLDALAALPARTVGFVDPVVQALEQEMGPEAIPALLPEMGREGLVDFAVMRLLASGYMRHDPDHAVGLSHLLESGLTSPDKGARGEAAMTVMAMLDHAEDLAGWPDPALVRRLAEDDPSLGPLVRQMDAALAQRPADAGE